MMASVMVTRKMKTKKRKKKKRARTLMTQMLSYLRGRSYRRHRAQLLIKIILQQIMR